jgi:hypothetical protein
LQPASARADDARGHGEVQLRRAAEARVADREDPLADLEVVGISERHVGQRRTGVDLDHRDVGVGIRADDGGVEIASVGEVDRDFVRAFDHVVVREDVAVLRHDEAAPGCHARLGLTIAATGHVGEEASERFRNLTARRLDHARPPTLDTDDRRRHGLREVREGLAQVERRLNRGRGHLRRLGHAHGVRRVRPAEPTRQADPEEERDGAIENHFGFRLQRVVHVSMPPFRLPPFYTRGPDPVRPSPCALHMMSRASRRVARYFELSSTIS